MNIFDMPMTFIDIETTGLSPSRDRIIEIAAIRVEHGSIVETYEKLVNPQTGIPPEITRMTGISPQQLEHAPRFFDIKEDIARLTENSIFVAHNVQFDYGFIRSEFKRYDYPFTSKKLCTVQLFRQLVPSLSHYNLDSLISYFGIQVKERHRALADTLALWEFFQKASEQYGRERIQKAAAAAMKRSRLPPAVSEEMIDTLPETSGVYLFYGKDEYPLYIGKSKSIKDRVLSHFSESANSSKEFKISQQITHIDTVETAGELTALLLEAKLIKKHQPMYNRLLKRVAQLIVVVEKLQDKSYATVDFSTVSNIPADLIDKTISIFRSLKQAKETILSIAKEHSLCPKLLGLESGKGACFWYSLGWCKGACIGKESVPSYNMRFTQAFSKFRLKRWPYKGPILVSEASDSKSSGVVIDNWCVLGVIEDQKDLEEIFSTPYTFDLDTYRILSRYLFSLKHQLHIKEIRI